MDQAVEFTRGIWTAGGEEFSSFTHPATRCSVVEATDSTVRKAKEKPLSGAVVIEVAHFMEVGVHCLYRCNYEDNCLLACNAV